MRRDYLSKTEQELVSLALRVMATKDGQEELRPEYRGLAKRFEQAEYVAITRPVAAK